MIQLPAKHLILVVDDEPDVFAVTRLNLRSMKYGGLGVQLDSACSGAAAVEWMRKYPETAVILLDVVMENDHAGLDACQQIRQELGNRLVRILLRTGQPGAAPEKQAIDDYDIDGYLPKAELTTTRLYAAVRTAIKAHQELVELERHRALLKLASDCASQVHSFDSLDVALQKVLFASVALTDCTLAVLWMATRSSDADEQLLLSMTGDGSESPEAAAAIAASVKAAQLDLSSAGTIVFGTGHLVPLTLHRDLGHGWIYLEAGVFDRLVEQVLPILAGHASNALYSVVSRQVLESDRGPFYDSLGV